MVPHDARRLSEDDDLFDFMEYDDPLNAKDESFKQKIASTHSSSDNSNSSSSSSSGSSGGSRLFGDDLDIKPEIDTGRVSESFFSFKKLWKYMGPGKVAN